LYSHPQHRTSPNVRRLRQEAGEWLRALREHKRLSQRELASKVGLDYYTFVSQLESGRGRIPPDRYEAWAQALGIDAQTFVRELMRYYDPVTHNLLFPDSSLRSDTSVSSAQS
jgi:transcriptional regulator with XRE-family HTH domain